MAGKKLVMVGSGRESSQMVYVLAAFLDRNETVWVDEETLALAAFMLANDIVPIKASRCRKTDDIAIRPLKSPIEDFLGDSDTEI